MTVKDIPVDQIEVGERRRTDFGDIGALAKGIKRVGLLSAIVVDHNGKKNHYRLIAGERRLRAVKMLKWKAIPASLLEHLTDEELRDLELEENDNRKSLTARERNRTFASSKQLVENAKKAAEVLAQSGQKPSQKGTKGGRPAQADSTAAVAEALGTSRQTVERAEQHVETAETFPFMQGAQWRRSDVLRVRERLAELPAEDFEAAAGVLNCARLLDPDKAVELAENLVSKTPAQRKVIYDLAQSEDPRNRSLALTEAAKLPPMPDPRLGILDNVLHHLNAAIKPYPKDPLTPTLAEIRKQLQAARAAVKEVSYDAQREQQKGAIQ